MTKQPIYREPGWYYRLNDYFREKFGQPVYKIPLDAGFSCPNRDGVVNKGGCTYCYNPSFSPASGKYKPLSLEEQIASGKKKNKSALYLAYFQAYTNTYAPIKKLRNLYDQALADPEVIGLSIATRPDCISDQILDLLEEYNRRCYLLLEYGLQSVHNKTLVKINRGHTAEDFSRAVELTHHRGIAVCAHIILGLPGESTRMFIDTINFLNQIKVEGVKFHHLQVIKHTSLAKDYAAGKVKVYNQLADYIPPLCDCLEILAPSIVVHRLASQATSTDLLIAPSWPESAGQIASAVTTELIKRGTHQGCH